MTHTEQSWAIFFAALASNLGLPTDVAQIVAGLRGLRTTDKTTVREACEQIMADFQSGALDERLA